jgi:hypothetical protein
MTRLDVVCGRRAATTDVTLRHPTNWTTVLFLGALGGLHLTNATTAFAHHRWEGYLSMIFATVFIGVAVICRLVRSDIAIQPAEKQVRLRTGLGRLGYQRFVPFDRVRAVRLTLLSPASPETARIEIVCIGEVIECPPTGVPREEALCLAVAIHTRLIKVYGEAFGPASERIDQIPTA